MPPAAISRSSTYLPKICGNIPAVHGSAAAIFWLLSGCSAPPAREKVLALQVHELESCPVPTPSRMDLAALGDFPTSNRTAESLSVAATDARLGFPVATLALSASSQAEAVDQLFIGYTERVADRLDFLLWPRGSACALFHGDTYPGKLGGEGLGYGTGSGLVMVAGNADPTGSAVVGALTFDARTGVSQVVDPRLRLVLSVPRAFASVSDFGAKLLVAGGQNPVYDPPSLNDTAEVYDPASASFEPDLLKLVVPRAQHAAVALGTGEVVLVGGLAPDSVASAHMEVVTPATRSSKLVESLWFGRNAPTALRLADGRLFVGGGTDEQGRPVSELEWRDPDATTRLGSPFDGSTKLPARFDRSFVAMPGGAVLAVGGCEDRAPGATEDCSAWCARGCPPSADPDTGERYDAFWISPDGGVSRLDFPLGAGQPVLLPGSDGRPWLVANRADDAGQPLPRSHALYRFDPWHQHFDSVPSDLGLDDALSATRFVATGTDAFVWLDQRSDGPSLHGARFATRSPFSSDLELVSQRDSEDPTRPAHLAPDHPPGTALDYDSVTGTLSFAATEPGGARTCVWLTDAEFADFSAKVGFDTPILPSLQIGTRLLADASAPDSADACALPTIASQAQAGRLELVRRGTRLSITLGDAHAECTVDAARAPVAVCASSLGSTRVTLFSVTRAG